MAKKGLAAQAYDIRPGDGIGRRAKHSNVAAFITSRNLPLCADGFHVWCKSTPAFLWGSGVKNTLGKQEPRN